MENENLVKALARLAEMCAKDENTSGMEALHLAAIVFIEFAGPTLEQIQEKLNAVNEAYSEDLAVVDLAVGISHMVKQIADGRPNMLRLIGSLGNALEILDRVTATE